MIGTRGVQGGQSSASMVTACDIGVIVDCMDPQASEAVGETELGKKLSSSFLKSEEQVFVCLAEGLDWPV